MGSVRRTLVGGMSQAALRMSSAAEATGSAAAKEKRSFTIPSRGTLIAGATLVAHGMLAYSEKEWLEEKFWQGANYVGEKGKALGNEAKGRAIDCLKNKAKGTVFEGVMGKDTAPESIPVEQTAEKAHKVSGPSFRDDKSHVQFLKEVLTKPMENMRQLHGDLETKTKEIEKLCADLSKDDVEIHSKIDEAMKTRQELAYIHEEIGKRLNNQEAGLDSSDLPQEKRSHMLVGKLITDTPADVRSYKKKVEIERATLKFDKVYESAAEEGREWDGVVRAMGGSAPELSSKIEKLRGCLEELVKTKKLMDDSYKDVKGKHSGAETSELINKLNERIKNYEVAVKNDETFAALETKTQELDTLYKQWNEDIVKAGDMGRGQGPAEKEMRAKAFEVLNLTDTAERANGVEVKSDRKETAAKSRELGNRVVRHSNLMNPKGIGYNPAPVPEKRTWTAFFGTLGLGAVMGSAATMGFLMAAVMRGR